LKKVSIYFHNTAGSSNAVGSNQIMVLAENKLTLHDIHALRNGDKSTVISTGTMVILNKINIVP
jgi:hypothetical protein